MMRGIIGTGLGMSVGAAATVAVAMFSNFQQSCEQSMMENGPMSQDGASSTCHLFLGIIGLCFTAAGIGSGLAVTHSRCWSNFWSRNTNQDALREPLAAASDTVSVNIPR